MKLDFDKLGAIVSQVVNAVGPVAGALTNTLAPEIAPALSMGLKIVQGLLQEEPAAIALYHQITGGTPPTEDQLKQFADTYQASWEQLDADIHAKLTK